MARKKGCPTNIRDWQVDVMHPASSRTTPEWVRVKSAESLTLSYDSDTEDGSSAQDVFSENYKTKINSTLSIECRRVVDMVTGDPDPGQQILDTYTQLAGCDGDGVLRLVDPVGRATIFDFIVTSNETSVDDTSETVSWDMDVVGAPERLIYVQATGVEVTDDTGAPVTDISIALGEVKTLTVKIAPENASNQRFGAASFDMTRVQISNVDGMTFDVVGLSPTPTPVSIVVKTKNNSLAATVAVTVTAV